jgi:hypothetical protein
LTTYTHQSQLQVIKTLSLINTLYKSQANSSQFLFTNRFPVTDLNNGDISASVLMSLPPGVYSATETSNKSESENYFATGGLLSISSSWRQAP